MPPGGVETEPEPDESGAVFTEPEPELAGGVVTDPDPDETVEAGVLVVDVIAMRELLC